MIPIPLLIKASLPALAGAALFGLGVKVGSAYVHMGWDRERTDRAELALAMEGRARMTEQTKARNVGAAHDKARTKIAAAAGAASAAGAELDRLLHTAAPAGAAAFDPAACARDHAAAAGTRELFNACAEAFAGMAREAGALAGQLIDAQGHIKAACVDPQP